MAAVRSLEIGYLRAFRAGKQNASIGFFARGWESTTKPKTVQERLERDIYVVARIQPREVLRHRVLDMTLRLVKPKEARRQTIKIKGGLICAEDRYYIVSQVVNSDLVPKRESGVAYLQRLLTVEPEFEILSMTLK
jgi:hypothetical protein